MSTQGGCQCHTRLSPRISSIDFPIFYSFDHEVDAVGRLTKEQAKGEDAVHLIT